MERRRFIFAMGCAKFAGVSLLAGCTGDDGTAANPTVTPTTEQTPTATATPTSDRSPSPSTIPSTDRTTSPTDAPEPQTTRDPSVELTSVDAADVAESYTILLTGTIENAGGTSATVLVEGEIDVRDGDTYTGRRLVTVPPDRRLDTRVKVPHSESGFSFFDFDATLDPDPDVSQDELRLSDDAHDLVVVGIDSDAVDEEFTVTAAVENRATARRTADLYFVILFSDGSEVSASRQISVAGGKADTVEHVFEPDDPTITYHYRAYVG